MGDNFQRMKECLEIAFNRVDLVITTGGLGPTMDDITKEVVAHFFKEDLEVSWKYYDKIVEKYRIRGFGNEIPGGGEKEASIIRGSRLIENSVGLAPGFFFEKDKRKIIVLPGPPKELTYMVDNEVLPLLREYSDNILMMKTLEIKGIPEGKIDDRLKDYFKMSNPTVAPYAKEGCVHVRVAMKGPKAEKESINREIDRIIGEIKEIYHQAEEVNQKNSL